MTTAAPSLSPGTSRTSLAPLVPLLVAAVVYVAVMAVGGSLLNDADTYWHIAAGNWIEQNGLRPAGPPWEDYLTDPAEHPDPKDWKTDVCWPVAPK